MVEKTSMSEYFVAVPFQLGNAQVGVCGRGPLRWSWTSWFKQTLEDMKRLVIRQATGKG
jgi:hypothetical protein